MAAPAKDVTATLSTTVQRLHISAGLMRRRAADIEGSAQQLLMQADQLRRDAQILADRADDLSELTK